MLKSRVFLGSLLFVLLVAIILVLGYWLEWSLVVQLAAVMGVLVVFLVLLVVALMRASRNAAEIEKSIKMQANKQLQGTRPDRQEEIKKLQQRLEAAIDQLKQSKLGKGRRGKSALYALPWYMVIGPPAAGKTTALLNSGLNFPMGTERIRGVGGTRNCDWFFSDAAIILDTAGRYMTEDEDSEEWFAFLETLKKHRSERPVNGIIVGISIADLVQASRDEIDLHAERIRARIDELIRRLGVTFPVYLLFTKCDLLQGFVEFFGEMSRRDREQVWGCTLSREEKETDAVNIFEREFHRLVDALNNARAARLGHPMKREERHKVYVFPLEFDSLRDNLSMFVGRLFQHNPYQESPIFRGFYFSSGTQEGVPIDRVIQSIAKQFDLPGESAQRFSPEMETKSYFIKEVFTDVIVPDQFMVRHTSHAATRSRFLQAGVAVAAVVLLGLFVLAASQAVVRSQSDTKRLHESALAVQDLPWRNPGALQHNLERLGEFRADIDLVERRANRFSPLRMGLYRGRTVLPSAKAVYYRNVSEFVRNYPFQRIEGDLRAASARPHVSEEERSRLQSYLKAYMLLTSEHERLENDPDRRFLINHLYGVTDEGVVRRLAVDGASEEDHPLRAHYRAYVQALEANASRPMDGDPVLVSSIQRYVYQQPTTESVYQRIRLDATLSLPDLTLAEIFHGRYTEYFSGEPVISKFFTREAYRSHVQDAIRAASADPGGDDWVMGAHRGARPAEWDDPESVTDRLTARYFEDYAAEWQRFLRQIRLRDFDNLSTAADRLRTLGNPSESPILWLLGEVQAQTTFTDPDAEAGLLNRARDDAAGRLPATGARGRQANEHPVERRFAALHELNPAAAASGGAPVLEEAIQGFSRIGAALNELITDDGTKAADMARQTVTQNGGAFASELLIVQSRLSRLDQDLRANLFEQPLRMSWGLVAQQAQRHLANRWADAVCRPFNATLGGRYPFDPDSQIDASLSDVQRFFQPIEGTIWKFVEEEVAPFTDRGDRPRTWDTRGVQIPSAASDAISQARRITEGLFRGSALRIDFEMIGDQPARQAPDAPNIGPYEINIHGTRAQYDLGRRRADSFTWPGSPGATLRVMTADGYLPDVRHEGDWAFFRLLQQGDVRPRTDREVQVRWPLPVGAVVVYDLRTPAAPNPFADVQRFFRFRCDAR